MAKSHYLSRIPPYGAALACDARGASGSPRDTVGYHKRFNQPHEWNHHFVLGELHSEWDHRDGTVPAPTEHLCTSNPWPHYPVAKNNRSESCPERQYDRERDHGGPHLTVRRIDGSAYPLRVHREHWG